LIKTKVKVKAVMMIVWQAQPAKHHPELTKRGEEEGPWGGD
jgi:hypothetical protein